MRAQSVSFVFLLFLLMGAAAASASGGEAIVHIENLNVRSGPGTHYAKLGHLQKGTAHPIKQKKNEWVSIDFHGTEGWIAKEYISIAPDAETAARESITVPQSNTQLRDGPSANSNIIHFADKGEKFNVVGIDGAWYEIENENIAGYVLKDLVEGEVTQSHPLKNKKIIIDAGHGGQDTGAIGSNGLLEKDVTYLTAMEISEQLTILGANVSFTRQEDTYASLQARAAFTNASNADAFISIHYNSAADSPQATGIGAYYYGTENKRMAQDIQKEVLKTTDMMDRDFSYGDFQVLRQNLHAAVLLELGFISNPDEEQLLFSHGYRQKLAAGVVNGLTTHFRAHQTN